MTCIYVTCHEFGIHLAEILIISSVFRTEYQLTERHTFAKMPQSLQIFMYIMSLLVSTLSLSESWGNWEGFREISGVPLWVGGLGKIWSNTNNISTATGIKDGKELKPVLRKQLMCRLELPSVAVARNLGDYNLKNQFCAEFIVLALTKQPPQELSRPKEMERWKGS